MINRIGFCGKAGTGKTTSAEYLVKNYGFRKMALADKLKEICRDLWPQEFVNGNKPRKLLQTIGTDNIRSYDADVWANYLIRQVNREDLNSYFPIHFVCDDVRFLNEARILKENGFYIIKIEGECRIPMPEGASSHSSEVGVDSIEPDAFVYNNGTLQALYERVNQVVSQ